MNPEIYALYQRVLDDPQLSLRDKRKLLDDIRSLIPGAQNRWNIRWIIWPLGLVALSLPALVFAKLFLAHPNEIAIPESLLALASAAVGALAGFLTPNNQRLEIPVRSETRRSEKSDDGVSSTLYQTVA